MVRVNDGQFGAVCPQCGSAAAVHSIGELAVLARNQLGQQQGYGPTPQASFNPPPPGYDPPADYNPPPPGGFGPPPDFNPPPPGGFGPPPDFNPPPPGGFGPPPPPGYQGPPPPGYTGSARPGQPSQSAQSMRSSDWPGIGDAASALEDGVADVVLGAAARFVGRAISRRLQRVVNERVLPTLAAKHETVMREQIAIAERHPDLRACLTDKVIFLAGGHRVLPMPSLTGGFTVEQSDAVVARLRDG